MEHITAKEAELLAQKAADKAVKQLLTTLGIDVKNVQETQADFAFNRKQRQVSEQITVWTRRTIYFTLITGLLGLFATGTSEAIKHFFIR